MRALAILAVVVAVGSAACGGQAPAATSSGAASVAQPLPVLTLPLISGGSWSSTGAAGKVLVIDVWASWCKPCKKAFPILDAFAARRTDVALVAISLDEDRAAIDAFLAEVPTTVAVAHDAAQSLVAAPLAIARLPTLLVVDAGGVIRYRFEQATEADYRSLDRIVDEVAALPAAAASGP